MSIEGRVKLFSFCAETLLPRPLEEIFHFFAAAENLERLTPPFLKFKVITPLPVPMKPGARIEYRIRVHGFPIRWLTEIAEWEPPHRFVDVQLRGPYRRWHHTHTFVAQENGTLCRDEVVYAPLGGALANWLLVRRDVASIFRYRKERLLEIFPAME